MSNKAPNHITMPGEMTIIKTPNRIEFYTEQVEVMDELLPGSVYTLNVDHQFGSLWLTPAAPLQIPDKIYDFEQDFREQVIMTLRTLDSNMNVGVLLEGYKGQGKSVTAKQLALQSELPIITINCQLPKIANFAHFLNQIKQDYVLFVDEFEKLFPDPGFNSDAENKMHGQNSFLSFLDGAYGLDHKRLVIFTSNKEIGDKFINRPSRIRYYKKFNFMKKQVFYAILEDKLQNKDHAKDLEDNIDVPSCTIDLLTTIIDEINIHNKPYSAFKDFFNHKDREITYARYKKNSETGKYEYFDDVKTKKEVGLENEYVQNVFGYQARVISNDGETIFYEEDESEYDDDDKLISKKKVIYKAIKNRWEKPNLSLVM